MVDNADLLVCPSLFVRNDLIDNFGIALERTAIVPYAVSRQWLELDTHPERGRVLFLGTADLRKGIHHFAMAARKLRAEGDNYEFVVAGGVTPEMREKGEAMGLTFLGRVPRSEIAAELQRADIVVLPSIAEGSAGATYEALAAGIPLVVSAAAGSVARDGVDGVVMDEPSADLIAEAVGAIVADRALRASMSAAAQQRAREFTWDRFGTRLISALLF
jgi:glycosyltransferase involved in cell wall biosynthesis